MGLFSRLHLDDGRVFQFKTGFDPWTDYNYKITDKIKWEPDNRWPGCHIDGVVEGWDEGDGPGILIAIKDCTIVGIVEPSKDVTTDDAREMMVQRYNITPPPRELWPEEAWEAKRQQQEKIEREYREWCEKKGKDPDDPASRMNYFTRIQLERDGFYRRIMPQVTVTNDELDRAVPTPVTEADLNRPPPTIKELELLQQAFEAWEKNEQLADVTIEGRRDNGAWVPVTFKERQEYMLYFRVEEGLDLAFDMEELRNYNPPIRVKKVSVTRALNEELFNQLATPGLNHDAVKAVRDFTLLKMYRLNHIPAKYYMPGAKPGTLKTLVKEMNTKGCIDLDEDGEPAVLTGKTPKLELLKRKEAEKG
jgi:hypothetical protein